MIITDPISLRGELLVSVLRNGQVIQTLRDKNMIMTVARAALAHLVAGDGAGKVINRIGIGVNGNGPTPDDTALTLSFVKAVASHSYPSAGEVRFNWSIGTGEANGMVIREFGLITTDNTLFARKTRAPIEKGNDISLEGSWTIIF